MFYAFQLFVLITPVVFVAICHLFLSMSAANLSIGAIHSYSHLSFRYNELNYSLPQRPHAKILFGTENFLVETSAPTSCLLKQTVLLYVVICLSLVEPSNDDVFYEQIAVNGHFILIAKLFMRTIRMHHLCSNLACWSAISSWTEFCLKQQQAQHWRQRLNIHTFLVDEVINLQPNYFCATNYDPCLKSQWIFRYGFK